MRALLAAWLLVGCSPAPGGTDVVIAPQASAPMSTTPERPIRRLDALADEVPWGEPGTRPATNAPVGIRSRIRLKNQPDTSEIVLEPCLSMELCPPIALLYEVQNTTDIPLTLWRCGFWPNHRVVIESGDGPAPLTKLGRDAASAFSPRGPREKNVEWPLPAHATDESEGPIDLGRLTPIFLHPPAPDRYTVRVDYEEDIAFESNTLTIWIVRPGALAALEKLNRWPSDEIDLVERPEAHPGRSQTGESAGYLGAHKDELAKLGVRVAWDPAALRYRVASSE